MSHVEQVDRSYGILRAALWCAAIAIVGMGAWGGLLIAGQRYPGFLPFVVPSMAAVLIFGAGYLRWGSWPRSGRDFRRIGVRLNPVSARAFATALVAGWSSMLCGFLLYTAHRSFAHLGGEAAIHFPNTAFLNLVPGLVMAGIVAGVVEEIAFRGFLQGALERRVGVVAAILVSGLLWAGFHLNHAYFGEEPLLWPAIFLAVSAILGTIAYRTDSVVPGIAVHSGFDAAYFLVAGYLSPQNTPIAYLQSRFDPSALLVLGGVAGMVAVVGWIGFMRATRR